jgi:hypothetical protein
MLGGKCVVCGYDKCKSALEPHHVDGSTKDLSAKRSTMSKLSEKFLEKEMKNCVLLCCRCHREIHAGVCTLPFISSI